MRTLTIRSSSPPCRSHRDDSGGASESRRDPAALSLKGRLSFLAKDSALYGGAAMISKAFGLITFPLLTRSYSIEDYGLINYFLVFSGLMATAFVFGQDSAVARYFYEHEDVAAKRRVITQSLVIQLAFLAVFLPLLWFASPWLAGRLNPSPRSGAMLGLVLLQVPFTVIVNFAVNLLKWTFARGPFLVMSLGSTAFNLVLLWIAVRGLHVPPTGVLAVSAVGSGMFALTGLFFVRRWLVVPREFGHAGELIRFAVPYGVIGILASFVPLAERSAVERLLGAKELGLYAAAVGVATLISLFVGAFQMAWGPFSLSIHKSKDASATYNWVLKGFVISVCGGILLLSGIARPLITGLASDRYAASAALVFPLAMGLGVQAAGWITEIGIAISKKTHLNLIGYAVFVAATLGGILLLGSSFGMYGVAAGVLAGHLAKAAVQSALAQSAHRLGWSYGPAASLILVTISVGLCARWVETTGAHREASAIFIIGALVAPIAGYYSLFEKAERVRLGAALARWRTGARIGRGG